MSWLEVCTSLYGRYAKNSSFVRSFVVDGQADRQRIDERVRARTVFNRYQDPVAPRCFFGFTIIMVTAASELCSEELRRW